MTTRQDLLTTYLRVSCQISRRFRSCPHLPSLTFPQAMTLHLLDRMGPLPITELADLTGSANSTVTGIVDRLELLELVKRVRSHWDRRMVLVSVTETYRRRCCETNSGLDGFFASVLDTMTQEDQKDILTGLQKLEAALTHHEKEGDL